MSLADQLAAKKQALHKQQSTKDASGPTISDRQHEQKQKEELNDYIAHVRSDNSLDRSHMNVIFAIQVRAADIDQWYTALQANTYKTTFIPISVEVAEAMIASFRTCCHVF